MHHSRHDATLIAGLAAGDLVDSNRQRAQALIADCHPCAELHGDLLAIADATRALPNLATAPRDFRLDPAQAARLLRGSWLRAALRPFGAAGSVARPMAAAFTSLGVAGLLVATLLPSLLGGAGGATASGPARDLAIQRAAASAAPAVPGPVLGAAGQPTSAPERADIDAASPDPGDAFGVKNSSPAPSAAAVAGALETTTAGGQSESAKDMTATPPLNPVLLGSVALLGFGLALFGLRFASRRLR